MAKVYTMTQTTPPEDEIDLVDLVVVLIRQRKLIIAITTLSLVIAVAGLMFYPSVAYTRRTAEATTEARMTLRLAPEASQLSDTDAVLALIRDPQLLLDALRDAGYTEIARVSIEPDGNEHRARTVVQRRLVENRSPTGASLQDNQRIFTATSSGGMITVTFRDRGDGHQERQLAFLAAVEHRAQDALREFLTPVAESVTASHQLLLDLPNPSQGVIAAIQGGMPRYHAARRLSSGDSPLLSPLRPPFLMQHMETEQEIRRAFRTTAVVIVFAGFFLAVFLAFIASYVDRVREDPAAVEKITRALNKTG